MTDTELRKEVLHIGRNLIQHKYENSMEGVDDLMALFSKQRKELLEKIELYTKQYDLENGKYPESDYEGKSVWKHIEEELKKEGGL